MECCRFSFCFIGPFSDAEQTKCYTYYQAYENYFQLLRLTEEIVWRSRNLLKVERMISPKADKRKHAQTKGNIHNKKIFTLIVFSLFFMRLVTRIHTTVPSKQPIYSSINICFDIQYFSCGFYAHH